MEGHYTQGAFLPCMLSGIGGRRDDCLSPEIFVFTAICIYSQRVYFVCKMGVLLGEGLPSILSGPSAHIRISGAMHKNCDSYAYTFISGKRRASEALRLLLGRMDACEGASPGR